MIKQIFICENAFRDLKLEVSSVKGVETGGAMVGYMSDTYAVVTHCSGPGPRSKKTYTSVFIDGDFVTDYCNNLINRSEGKLYYLGDWHIHLVNNLYPSTTDINAMKVLLKSKVNIWGVLMSMIFFKDLSKYRGYVFGSHDDFYEVPISLCSDPEFMKHI